MHKRRRKAKANGQNVDGKDFDHKTGKFTSIKTNRGNRSKGTKSESGAKYRVKKHS